ncbi:MAG: hypothetical protein PHD87_08725 [Candidatus Cloacimonetes bacterium]|nr:hypothetical protein [Candidatus Cloacimonadota bacterium]
MECFIDELTPGDYTPDDYELIQGGLMSGKAQGDSLNLNNHRPANPGQLIFIPLPLSLRDKYGINTDEIRIDPVFIPY